MHWGWLLNPVLYFWRMKNFRTWTLAFLEVNHQRNTLGMAPGMGAQPPTTEIDGREVLPDPPHVSNHRQTKKAGPQLLNQHKMGHCITAQ